jgi:hypothetical protein
MNSMSWVIFVLADQKRKKKQNGRSGSSQVPLGPAARPTAIHQILSPDSVPGCRPPPTEDAVGAAAGGRGRSHRTAAEHIEWISPDPAEQPIRERLETAGGGRSHCASDQDLSDEEAGEVLEEDQFPQNFHEVELFLVSSPKLRSF